MNQKQQKPRRWNLTLLLMLFVFGVIILAIFAAGAIIFLLHAAGKITFLLDLKPGLFSRIPFARFLLQMMFLSGLIALALTWFFSKLALNPLRKVIDATRKVAAGDFSVQVRLKGIEELEELSQSFNKMTRELSTIETLRSDFVNHFSHEFKTPLVSIQGFAELLEEGGLSPEEQKDYLGIIIAESQRLAALATKTLTLSKYENIEILADKAPFRLDEQIRRAITFVEQQWMAKRLDVHVELEKITFTGNEDFMQQIWMNLLDNAIKFSPQGGNIHIRLQWQSDAIRFTIQDEGIGMDEQAKAHCFDKFYQADESQTKPGNGLGLAIVKRMLELHGGAVEVQSAPAQGSIFTVILKNQNENILGR